MATLENIGDCPVCQHPFSKPEAFLCLHFCCKTCIEDMAPTTEGNNTGYNCPQCRKFTPKEQLRPMHFVQELLEVVESAKEEGRPCEKCKTETPVWRCTDCKESYCSECREHHDGFSMLKNHEGELLSRKRPQPPVMDRQVFCDQHPRKIIEYHCKDCSQLICNTCNGTDHKQHSAESIEDALAKAVPLVKENAQKLGHLSQVTESALVDSRHRVKELKKEYGDLDEEIDRKQEELSKKMEDDYNNVKTNVAAIRARQMEEATQHIKELEMTLQSQRNIARLSDTTLSTAQGTSLLYAIQTGLGEGLLTYVSKFMQPMTYTDGISAKFIPTGPSQENAIGSVTELPTGKHSLYIPHSLGGITRFTTKMENQITTPFKSTRFTVFNGQLWFAAYGTNQIHVCSLEGKLVMTLTLPEINEVRSLVQSQWRVLIAAKNGVFLVDHSHKIDKVLDGEFSSVSCKGNTIFALNNGEGKVHILRKCPMEKGYTVTADFNITEYQKNIFNTIQATNRHIYIAHYGAHCILQYDHRGDNMATHGSAGKELGQLQYPQLSGADSNGILLVADYGNNRFQSLLPDDNWSAIEVEGLGANPLCAVFLEDTLYVQGHSDLNKLQMFSLQ